MTAHVIATSTHADTAHIVAAETQPHQRTAPQDDAGPADTANRRPLSVLIVSESSLEQTNGVSGSVRHILARFAERGFDARVIAPGPAPQGDMVDGYPVSAVPTWPIQQFNVAIPTKSSVIRTIKDGPKPDIIHVAAPISKLGHAALIAGRRLDVPTVAIYQTDVAQYARRFAREAIDSAANSVLPKKHTGWLRKIGRAAGDGAEQIVGARIAKMHNMATLTLAPTDQAKARLESFGVDARLIYQWGRGVDVSLFNPSRAASAEAARLHRQWSHSGTLPVVGYVGRLAPEKQVDRLAALAGLGIQLVIVGGGPCEEQLEELLPDAVFTGMLHGEDLANAYAALDVFVHTGAEETFGQTIQEAMASGLPVVAPAAGGPLDLVDDGRTGLLFDPADDHDLRAAVERLAGDANQRHGMGQAGFETVRSRTWPALVDRLVDYYRLAYELHLAGTAPA
ncbi:glycosyltransferase family 4 protein [Bifidobacterium leontopitheci]|uniref:Glycosyltransferase n=1 Tax=Bifidobacterium leontopitheci TaxID=2650774 RepID=A0A6I1GKB1_9BIFI|nr:glycosyltransferase family 1 protein [Bifidobacterium leontopitheci]KAB7789869.1 glycosyltransferase [Bifidobacterium leontopitheci]